MAKIKQPANLKKWNASVIYCVKEHSMFEDEMTDCTVQYIYSFAIAPEVSHLGREYKILAEAIKKEDDDVLGHYFGTPGTKEIRAEEDDLLPDGIQSFKRFYSGEKWGLIYDFSIETFVEDGKTGYINTRDGKYFYFLPQYPLLLVDALNMFNALSFENTTHVIRLHQMWNRLREIRDLAFDFQDTVEPQDMEEGYTKFFIPIEKVLLKTVSETTSVKIIKLINAFEQDYRIKKAMYFKDLADLKREAKWIASDYKNAFEGFLGKILHNYIYYLEKGEILKGCRYCEKVFPYAKNKRFCSEKDGNNCGQTVRNKRFYKKNRGILLPKARKITRELRQTYKKHGIAK